ncbi:SusC/RagA family TonB-linked outer membrane protein [Mucilaginibacter sp. HME9299]|uniref:SusC/RagA family TonB-linked outer membrane protein n=2 Tax=Mucilaginibacter aquatilis TaxID=1517760 RepID=A0A6I4IQI4_9SPHI|nr:SusC/RagA family TonB-linked outer membrane protein [Mucilaginibacter aquatilis]
MKFQDLIRSGHSACNNLSVIRIVKLTIFLMTTFFIQVSAAGFAQKVTFVKQNASFKELFTEIRKQTGYNVFWQDSKVNEQQKINVAFKGETLQKVLDQTLPPYSLTYKIVNKTVVIQQQQKTLIDKVVSYFSSVNVTGKVLDAESGKPVPNVTVNLKNTTQRVYTNENGTFNFRNLPDDAILVFSYIGYTTQEVAASDVMVVRLMLTTQKLDDVIVSNGYQQVRKGSTTGSSAVLTAKDIETTPSISLIERLEGKVPGVRFDVRNNTIQIRGTNGISMTENLSPLLIIDGFPATNQNLVNVSNNVIEGNPRNVNQPATAGNAILNNINPNDIESITFLKDAAAASIWGSKAANGVIVITTKRGKQGAPSIDYSMTLSTAQSPDLSKLNAMNSQQYIDLEREMFDKGFFTDPTLSYRYGPISEAQEWMFRVKRGKATAAQRDSALSVLGNRSNADQLKKYLLQKAATQQHNLSISGGGANNTYYLAANYSKDVPIFKSNYGETFSLTSNLTNDFWNKRILVATNINFISTKSQVNNASSAALSQGPFGFAPYEMIVDANGNPISKPIMFTQRVSDSLARIGYMPWTYNPIDELNYNNTILLKNSLRVSNSIRGIITSWLNVNVSGQFQRQFANQDYLQNQNSYLTRNLINTGTVLNATTRLPSYGVPVGGVYKTSNGTTDEYSLRAQFNINKNWTDHHFDMLGGAEIRQTKYKGGTQTRYGYNEDTGTSVVVNPTINYPTIFGYSTNLGYLDGTIFANRVRYLSYFSLATYSYKNKYYASGSVRFDDYTNQGLSRKLRATPLYSAGLRWNVKRENFLSNISWLSGLTLRATIGTGGSIPNSGYSFATVTLYPNDSYTLLPTAGISGPANSRLTWETTRTFNEGIDADFFNGRLALSMDIYQKRNYNLFVSLPYNSTYGFSNLTYNAGDAKGRGIEFNLTGQPIMTNKWNWTSSFNFSYTENTVTDSRFKPTFATAGGKVSTQGFPTDNIFVYKWAGLDNKGQSRIYGADGTILNVSGSRSPNINDLTYGGRTTPPYFGGWTNTVRYQNLSLIVRATYNLGHKVMLTDITGATYPTGTSTSGYLPNTIRLLDRWRNPGDENFTNIPGLAGNNFTNVDYFVNSDYNLIDAGNIRLQQLSLNYSLPQTILRKAPFIKAINVGATVSNLGLIWRANKLGVDPDYQRTGNISNLPPARTYLFNLNISL